MRCWECWPGRESGGALAGKSTLRWLELTPVGSSAAERCNCLDTVDVRSAPESVKAIQFAATYPQRTRARVVASGPFGPVDPELENSPHQL
jgi:hypothetical protein